VQARQIGQARLPPQNKGFTADDRYFERRYYIERR
jgi:hypothetical protein